MNTQKLISEKLESDPIYPICSVMRHLLKFLLLAVAIGLPQPAVAVTVAATNGLSCAGARASSSCNSNDFTTTVSIGSQPGSCISGGYYILSGQVNLTSASPDRYDIGFFVGEVGNAPTATTTLAQGASCSVTTFPTSPLPWFQSSSANTCGDFKGSLVDALTIQNIKVYCQGNASGELSVPYALVWSSNDNQGVCTGPSDVKAGSAPKCIAGTAFVSGVTVLPSLTKTDNVSSTVIAGSTTSLAYAVQFGNLSQTISTSTFTDPPPSGFTVSGITCASNPAGNCPTDCSSGTCSATAVTAITAGSGISVTLPAAINSTTPSSVTFTINGSYVAPNFATTFTNTAQAAVGSGSSPASDTIAVMVPPTVAKSFSPAAVAPNVTSTLTITLTNPDSAAIRGAAFTDTYPSTNLKNAATLNLTNTCGGTASGTAGGSVLSLSGGIIPANGSCSVSVSVTSAVAGSYLNSTGALSTSNAGSGTAATATLAVLGTVSSFNAFESSTAANSITGRIYTKLAGTAFNLDVVAITSSAQASTFNGNVKVELLANTGVAGSGYGADNCPTANSVIQSIASAAISSGRSAVNFTAVANAYQDVRVRISYPTSSPTITVCSTDSFAIRPVVFTITSTNATNNNTSGAPVIKAGASFNLTATATAGYSGTPSVDNTKVTGTSTAGTLSGSFAAATSATGVALGTYTYSEVGNFGLNSNAVKDTTFTSIDTPGTDCVASSYSNALSGGMYGCNIGSTAVLQTTGASGFGRFIPDHFDTAIILASGVPMTCPSTLTCPSNTIGANGMVYSGQSFTVQVTAKNLAGATTANYQGVYAKAVTLSAMNAAGGATANPGGGTLANAALVATAFISGVATTTQTYTLPVYTVTPTVAPTDFYIRAVDTDSVTSLRASSVEAGLKVAYGKIKVSNAYGSELLPLTLTATAQYYTASGWTNSITDSITSLSFPATVPVGSGTTAVTPVIGTMSVGKLTVNLAKPSAGAGIATITPTAPAYLPVTSGTGTFGIYKGKNDFIYQREAY